MRNVPRYALVAIASVVGGVVGNLIANRVEKWIGDLSASQQWLIIGGLAVVGGVTALLATGTTFRWRLTRRIPVFAMNDPALLKHFDSISPPKPPRYIREEFAYQVAQALSAQGTDLDVEERLFKQLFEGRHIRPEGWNVELTEHPQKMGDTDWCCNTRELRSGKQVWIVTASDISHLRSGDCLRIQGRLIDGSYERIGVADVTVKLLPPFNR